MSTFSLPSSWQLNAPPKKSVGNPAQIDKYVAMYAPDLISISTIGNGLVTKVLSCRFCYSLVSARTDRIKEHIGSKRHQKNKQAALAGRTKENDEKESDCRMASPTPTHGDGIDVSINKKLGSADIEDNSSSPTFYINWHRYDRNLHEKFSEYRDRELFTDVTICCGQKSFACHKIILSASSLYFKQLLDRRSQDHDHNDQATIFLTNFHVWEIEALLNFMYNGEITVLQSQLPSLMRSGAALQVKGLPIGEMGNKSSSDMETSTQ